MVLILDILRYVLCLASEELPIKECMYILEWLFYRVCSNNLLCELWKDELFFPCFAEPCPFPNAPERVVRFLAYLLEIDMNFGETLLIYLLHHYSQTHESTLRTLLLKAN